MFTKVWITRNTMNIFIKIPWITPWITELSVDSFQGLQFLDIMLKRKEMAEEAQNKETEMRERDKFNMSKPEEAIPMPYDDPNSKRVEAFGNKCNPR